MTPTTMALLCSLILGLAATGIQGQLSENGSEDNCPVWFTYDPEHQLCLCSDSIEGYITCRQQERASYLHLGIVLGYNHTLNETVVASIPYVLPRNVVMSNLIKLTNNPTAERIRLCNSLHRTHEMNHTFCGKCAKNHGPAIYTFGMQCAKCSHWNLGWYILLQILPITVIYVFVLVFKIRIIAPTIFHYILFCNAVTVAFRYSVALTMSYTNATPALHYSMKVILTLIGFWTLDFFRFVFPPFCVFERLKDMNVPMIDIIPAVYLLILTLIIALLVTLHEYQIRPVVWIWKPFKKILVYCKQNRDPREALSHTYATFFFLFFSKTLYVTVTTILLTDAFTYNGSAIMKHTVYYDPTTSYFKTEHIIMEMVVVIIAAILILPALFLLIIFHSRIFHKFCQLKVKKGLRIILRTFVQTFQDGYKDGTKGTRDYRPMAGGYLLGMIFVLAMMLIGMRKSTYGINLLWPSGCTFFTTSAIIFGVFKPYKRISANASAVALNGITAIVANFACFVSQRPDYSHGKQHHFLLALILVLVGSVNFIFTIYITYKVISSLLPPNGGECLKALWKKLRLPCMHTRHNEESSRLLNSTGVRSNSQ